MSDKHTIRLTRTDAQPTEQSVEVSIDATQAESNIFVAVDGVNVGSLFFGVNSDGQRFVTFGAYCDKDEWWMAATPTHALGYTEPASLIVPNV